MKVRDVMTDGCIRISPEESAAVAARMLERYNVGMLPVCAGDGRLCGVVTDRDLVTRCMAAGLPGAKTSVRRVMTTGVISVQPDSDAQAAAALMGYKQVRRLPVVENGRLCGVVSLADLALNGADSDALRRISSNLSDPEGQM